ncbi:hypothetical protein ACIPL1_07655 [Pseudomonas sp. NPDC090202]|uniref:hypothetical protein n=1 Tax=Pseudomonas sp. NPDC090202 TaxID=3364476 RepID=UPI0038240EA6
MRHPVSVAFLGHALILFSPKNLLKHREPLISTCLLSLLCYALNAEADVSHDELQTQIRRAVDRVSKDEKFLVDPRIVSEIISDAENFRTNLCYSSQKPCVDTILDDVVLSSIIRSFFEDLKATPSSVQTVASRLAQHAGKSMGDAGWPDKRDNEVSAVRLPDFLIGSEMVILAANKRITLGSAGSLLYVWPGTKYLTAEWQDGRIVNGIVQAPPHANGTWTTSHSENSLPLGKIDPDLSLYCPAMPEERSQENTDNGDTPAPLGLFNYGRATIVDSQLEPTHTIAAARQPGLEIIINDTTTRCDNNCVTGLSIAFAQAISIWRSGCARCEGNSLVVIHAGKHTWIDMRAADRLRGISRSLDGTIDFDLSKMQPNEMQRYLHAPSYWQAGGYIVGYEQIDQDDQLLKSLCDIDSSVKAGWIAYAQGLLCPGHSKQAVELTPQITITKGWTACGEEAIACAAPGGLIQITAKYSYEIQTANDSRRILGTDLSQATFDLESVILHEVGHWFGLRHPEEINLKFSDIMQGSYNSDNNCVSAQSLTMLNNATDDRWEFRASANQGLMPPRTFTGVVTPSSRR